VKGLGTNVLVRYLAQDDPDESAIATAFIETQCTQDAPCFINHITLCELVSVLEDSYRQDRASIVSIIEQLLQVGQLAVLEPEIVWKALSDFKESNSGFSDHLIARVNQEAGCNVTMTLDKRAGQQPRYKLLGGALK
jgi:predicted nucleic-acid-binding protein|tara:strand:+ start:634 stop:1044 length:411 start_codon:yes stop_codon:yes gene_type:complete